MYAPWHRFQCIWSSVCFEKIASILFQIGTARFTLCNPPYTIAWNLFFIILGTSLRGIFTRYPVLVGKTRRPTQHIAALRENVVTRVSREPASKCISFDVLREESPPSELPRRWPCMWIRSRQGNASGILRVDFWSYPCFWEDLCKIAFPGTLPQMATVEFLQKNEGCEK